VATTKFAYAAENPQQLALDMPAYVLHRRLVIFPISNTAHNASLTQLKNDHFPFVLVIATS